VGSDESNARCDDAFHSESRGFVAKLEAPSPYWANEPKENCQYSGDAEQLKRGRAASGLTRGVLFDVVDRVLDGPDFLGVFVRDIDFECFFERKHQLDESE